MREWKVGYVYRQLEAILITVFFVHSKSDHYSLSIGLSCLLIPLENKVSSDTYLYKQALAVNLASLALKFLSLPQLVPEWQPIHLPVFELVWLSGNAVLHVTELRLLIFGRVNVFLLVMHSAVESLNGKVCLTFQKLFITNFPCWHIPYVCWMSFLICILCILYFL